MLALAMSLLARRRVLYFLLLVRNLRFLTNLRFLANLWSLTMKSCLIPPFLLCLTECFFYFMYASDGLSRISEGMLRFKSLFFTS